MGNGDDQRILDEFRTLMSDFLKQDNLWISQVDCRREIHGRDLTVAGRGRPHMYF